MRNPAYDSMDDALEMLSVYGPDLSNGMTSHAPMAAEALCAMGRADAVKPFLARYCDGMLPRPRAVERLSRENWRAALAQTRRFEDFSILFNEELEKAPWRVVLDHWVGELVPGICAAAAHGVIRVGHAARSLAESETPLRRRELADALASWAAEYQELPVGPAAGKPSTKPAEAIREVALVPVERRRFSGSIVSGLVGLDEIPEFAGVIGLLDVGGDTTRLAAELGELFTRIYLANANNFLSTIVFVHGVTSVAAVGNLLPSLSDANARDALRYAWQAGCGLYTAFGFTPVSEATEAIEPPAEDEETLIQMAIDSGDEHAIKFTEACLGFNALHPSPIYLAAAKHSIGALKQ